MIVIQALRRWQQDQKFMVLPSCIVGLKLLQACMKLYLKQTNKTISIQKWFIIVAENLYWIAKAAQMQAVPGQHRRLRASIPLQAHVLHHMVA